MQEGTGGLRRGLRHGWELNAYTHFFTFCFLYVYLTLVQYLSSGGDEGSLLFVLGGVRTDELVTNFVVQDVEVLDLRDEQGSCPSAAVSDYPNPITYSAMAYVNGAVSSCGGFEGSDSSDCYDYDPSDDSWTAAAPLSEARQRPSSCVMPQSSEWFITGGTSASSGTTSTEIRRGGVSLPGPEAPDGLYRPCQLALNDTQVFIADGYDGYAYILDWEAEEWHNQVGGMMRTVPATAAAATTKTITSAGAAATKTTSYLIETCRTTWKRQGQTPAAD